MCTVKELKEYLSGLPEDTEVSVLQEDSGLYYSHTSEKLLVLSDYKLIEYNELYKYLLLGGYA